MAKKQSNIFYTIIYIFIFIIFILGLYLSPKTIEFLFTSNIGIGILILSLAFITYINYDIGFGILLIFIILYLSIYLSSTKKEGFLDEVIDENNIKLKNGWTKELYISFVKYQSKYNPSYFFDMDIVQQQATPEETKEYLETGRWTWSPEIQNIYKEAILIDPYVSFSPGTAIDNAQQIYNETAIKQLLAWDTKEGRFILNGVTIGHTKNLPENINNTIRCGKDGKPIKTTHIKAPDGTSAYMVQNYEQVKAEDLPVLINGFSFLKEPCNPCSILNEDILKYNCPFSLDVGDGGTVSGIWTYLWGLETKPTLFPEKEDVTNCGVKSKLFLLNNGDSIEQNVQDYQLNTNF